MLQIGQDDKINLGSMEIDCLFTPCHTSGHVCYYIKSENNEIQKPAVFTGTSQTTNLFLNHFVLKL